MTRRQLRLRTVLATAQTEASNPETLAAGVELNYRRLCFIIPSTWRSMKTPLDWMDSVGKGHSNGPRNDRISVPHQISNQHALLSNGSVDGRSDGLARQMNSQPWRNSECATLWSAGARASIQAFMRIILQSSLRRREA